VSIGSNGVHIALTQQHIINALHFHHAEIFWLEEHPIPNFNGSHIWSNSHNSCPTQTASDVCRRRNHDATAGSTLTLFRALSSQDTVMEQLDRNRTVGIWSHIRKCSCHELSPPGTNDLDDDDAGDNGPRNRYSLRSNSALVIVKPTEDGAPSTCSQGTG
jgi:hypothetical protein